MIVYTHRTAVLATGLLLLAASVARAADETWQAAGPVYQGVETVADGVYGLVRGHLFAALLPGRLSRSMSAVPVGSSDRLFTENLKKRQARASRRILASRPSAPTSSPAALAVWRNIALEEEKRASIDAVADTLLQRYQLERFGQASGVYALNPGNWDAEFLASAATLGSAYLYVAGLSADWTFGSVRVDLDSPTGDALRETAQSGEGRVAELRFSKKGFPLSLNTAWGLRGGSFSAESVGVACAARF
ncbi:MAG: hypothetical protein AAB036_00545 [Elusimicrobiota bacterium]